MNKNKNILHELEIISIQCIDIDEKNNFDLTQILKQLEEISQSSEFNPFIAVKPFLVKIINSIELLIMKDTTPIDDIDEVYDIIYQQIDTVKRTIENITIKQKINDAENSPILITPQEESPEIKKEQPIKPEIKKEQLIKPENKILQELEIISVQCIDINEKNNFELAQILKHLEKISQSSEFKPFIEVEPFLIKMINSIELLIMKDIDPIDDLDAVYDIIYQQIDTIKRTIEKITIKQNKNENAFEASQENTPVKKEQPVKPKNKILQELELISVQCIDINEKDNFELAQILKYLEKISKSSEFKPFIEVEPFLIKMIDSIELLIMKDIDPIDDLDAVYDIIYQQIDTIKRTIEKITIKQNGNTFVTSQENTPVAKKEEPQKLEINVPKIPQEEKKEEAETIEAIDETEIDDEEDDIFSDFLQEMTEYVETLESEILNLEEDPTNKEIINNIFRPFHTLKGVSGFMGLKKLNKLSHETENLLDLARNDKILITPDIIDGILTSIDIIKLIRKGLSVENRVEQLSDEQLNGLIALLRSLVKNQSDENVSITAPTTDIQKLKESIQTNETETFKKAETIKIKTEKIDQLNNMVGELVITTNLIREDGNILLIKDLNFQRKFAQMSLVVRELQKVSMSLRMVPIASTFQKMKRVVRDYSSKTKKPIMIQFKGEDTEIDRNFVEHLSDPLVHMIRNSCDHGIENEANRIASNKPKIGNILLHAYHRGNTIIIDVTDDGKGLDKDAIRAKAIERGILTDDQKVTDEEIYKCILAPGFSTAQKITNVSGRGVGMDVVISTLKSMGGNVTIISEKGKGSTMRLSLPLTLAIIEGVLVKSGQELFIIPVVNVKRTIQPSLFQQNNIFGSAKTIKIGDKLLPIMKLGEIFNISNCKNDINDSLLIVIENQDRQFALVVDELVGIQDVVVKNLGEKFKNLEGISGATILGDGSIGLILDLNSLMNW